MNVGLLGTFQVRVLFINYEFPPIGGGGANATQCIFAKFADRTDLEIDLVTSGLGPDDGVEQYSPNINVHRLAVRKQALHFWTQREVLTFMCRAHGYIGKLAATNRYDLCHAFFGFPSGLLAYLRRAKMPYLVSLRGSDVPGFNIRFARQYIVLKPIFRRIWTGAQVVTANSIGLRDLAHEFMPDLEISVIPNGVDTVGFRPNSDGMPGSPRILCVSRLIERKGVHHLLEAMPIVAGAIPGTKLTVIGDGDYYQRLVARAEELNVHDLVEFRGYVPHEDLASEYQSASIYVQPSFYEGMSNTVLEAMATGLPIIASGKGGDAELYKDNSKLVEFGNPAALGEAIVDVLGNPDRLRSMGERSRAIANSFSWEAVARGYLDIYRNIALDGNTA